MELFFLETAEGRGPFWGAPSAFFALPTPADAEKVVQVLLQQEELGAALPGGSAAAEATGSILEVGPVSMLAGIAANFCCSRVLAAKGAGSLYEMWVKQTGCESVCRSPGCWQWWLCPGGIGLGPPPERVDGALLLWNGVCLLCWLKFGSVAATVLPS